MGRLPVSPQIYQKLIKIWNNSYKATPRWQQKTPGLQWDRLSSLKWGRREDGDQKGKWQRTSEQELFSLKEGGIPEMGGVPMHREAPSQVDPKGSCGVSENQAKQGFREQKSENAALLSPLQITDCDPQPDSGLGNREWGGIQTFPRQTTLVAQRALSVAWHANLWRAHNPHSAKSVPGYWERGSVQTWAACTTLAAQRVALGSQKNTQAPRQRSGQWDRTGRGTQTLRCGGHVSGAKISEYKPEKQRAGLESQIKCTPAPRCRGSAWEAKTSVHKPWDIEGELRGLRKACTSLHHAKGTRKDPHKPLPSKFRPAVQGGMGNRSTRDDPRDK